MITEPSEFSAAAPELRGPAAARLRKLVAAALPGAQIVRVVPLKPDSVSRDESAKGAGYGAPLRIDVQQDGVESSFVLRTATPNEYGHDRRADRAGSAVLAADSFDALPRHVSVVDVGAYRGATDFVSLRGTNEFYLLTTYVAGRVYAEDLRRIARTGALTPADAARSAALVDYLARLHRSRPAHARVAYARFVRDTLGSGEGIFGIVDGYPDDVPGAPRERLDRLEEQCLKFRRRLRGRHERLRRTHGDFHPFNVVFDEKSALFLLDTSRGSLGDPGDDVACMAINYAFFALGHPGAWRAAFRSLWYDFWERYAAATGDDGLYEVVAPLLAWRGLVLASPTWYPELGAGERDRILGFVERALGEPRFSPSSAEEFFDT
jgi:hypothetical protein